jgi:hypothetical protein
MTAISADPFPPAPASGSLPRDPAGLSDIRFVMVEVARLQTQQEHFQQDLRETRTDVKDSRDRLARLEERVSHLPGKGFIVAVVTSSLLIIVGLLTIAPKLQLAAGTAVAVAAEAPGDAAATP